MNTDSIQIAPVDFDDPRHLEGLINLMNEYRLDKMGDGIAYTEEEKELLVRGLSDLPGKVVLLAWDGQRYVGLVTGFINFATFTVKKFVNIHDIIVTEEYRNKGIGRRLLLEVIELSRKLGCSKVTLEVRNDNENAMHLYSSLGFEDTKPRMYYWAKYLE